MQQLPKKKCPECGAAWNTNEELKRNFGLERLVCELPGSGMEERKRHLLRQLEQLAAEEREVEAALKEAAEEKKASEAKEAAKVKRTAEAKKAAEETQKKAAEEKRAAEEGEDAKARRAKCRVLIVDWPLLMAVIVERHLLESLEEAIVLEFVE